MWYIGGDGDGYCLTIILYMRLNFVRVFFPEYYEQLYDSVCLEVPCRPCLRLQLLVHIFYLPEKKR